jgi:hypothetical protein
VCAAASQSRTLCVLLLPKAACVCIAEGDAAKVTLSKRTSGERQDQERGGERAVGLHDCVSRALVNVGLVYVVCGEVLVAMEMREMCLYATCLFECVVGRLLQVNCLCLCVFSLLVFVGPTLPPRRSFIRARSLSLLEGSREEKLRE